MSVKLVGEPWDVPNRYSVHFWAEINLKKYLCRISGKALLDDYQQPGDRDLIEVFREFAPDVLRRTEQLLSSDHEVIDGEPAVIILSGQAMP